MTEDEANHALDPRLGPRIWGGAILVCVLGFAIAWSLLPPPLPNVVRLGTGPVGGRYDRMLVDGPIRRLNAPMFHYTYTGISDQLATVNRFSSITAQTNAEESVRFRLHDLLLRPPFRLFRGYILKLGFLDGIPGLIIATTTAFGVFAKYAKLWEKRLAEGGEARDT